MPEKESEACIHQNVRPPRSSHINARVLAITLPAALLSTRSLNKQGVWRTPIKAPRGRHQGQHNLETRSSRQRERIPACVIAETP